MDPLLYSFLALATLLTLAAYFVYLKDIRRDNIKPNRWSWLIWSFAIVVEAFTYEALNDDLIKSATFFISAIACIITTFLIWGKAKWEAPNKAELITTITSTTALILWLVFHETFWAHIIIVATLPIAFSPTWHGAKKGHEDSHAWKLWTLGDLSTLAVILLRFKNFINIPYIAIETASHAMVWWMASKQRSQYLKYNPKEKREDLFHTKSL